MKNKLLAKSVVFRGFNNNWLYNFQLLLRLPRLSNCSHRSNLQLQLDHATRWVAI